ncbi:Putative toxin component near putative ESAT-related protein, repetitive [Bacillus mycoides]|nr:Putative toxin component near putative ESAT-related protein, repetitive [Bacillus mycoides]
MDFFVHLIVLLRVKKVHFVNPIGKHGVNHLGGNKLWGDGIR